MFCCGILQLHGMEVVESDDVIGALEQLQQQTPDWSELQRQFQKSMCLTNWLHSAALS